MDMSKKSGLRSWYYFRTGWGTYFTFIFSAINSLVITYYLAIKKLPVLEQIFPSIFHYAFIMISVLIPILLYAGYVYFKKSQQFTSEADINIESNPHWNRILTNTDISLIAHSQILEYLITKSSQKNTLDDSKYLSKFNNELENLSKRKTLT